jgi:hypothetical protein
MSDQFWLTKAQLERTEKPFSPGRVAFRAWMTGVWSTEEQIICCAEGASGGHSGSGALPSSMGSAMGRFTIGAPASVDGSLK